MKKIILLTFLYLTSFAGVEKSLANNINTADNNDCPPPADTIRTVPRDTSGKYFLSVLKRIRLSGFTQIRYQDIENGAHVNGFDIRRARLNFQGDITNKLTYQLQLELAGTPKVLDANAEYTFNPYFKIKVGQFKVPMSYEEFYLDRSTQITINGAQITEALTGNSTDVLGNNNGRDIGGMISGAYAGNKSFNIVEYYVGVFNGNGTNVADNNKQKDFAGRLRIQPVKGLWIAGFYYDGKASYGTDITTIKARDRWGGELVFTRDRFTINGEYIHGTDYVTNRYGYYGQAAAFVLPKKLQVFVKYDSYNSNIDLKNAITTVTSSGVNYYFTSISRIMFNYEWHGEKGTEINNDVIIAELQIGF